MQIKIDENREELFNKNYFEKNSEKYNSFANKKFLLFERITNKKYKFNIKKKKIYSLLFFGFVIILGLQLFFISQSKKNESNSTSKSILLEDRF